jgi:hypothetical protein
MNKERYTKQLLYKRSLEIIEEYTPTNITNLISYLGVSKDTFYKKIKVNSKEYAEILEFLDHKKTVFANDIKQKMLEMNTFKSLEFLFKLYCTKEDREALSNNYNVNAKTTEEMHKIDREKVEKIENNFKKLTAEEKKQFQRIMAKLHSN